ncbi:MAG TPA: hypothetical protein VNA17_00450 [Pyrinomonadaceae bacterium]|nr:hypothetical protein [Pyrinomonadaceae bacterium]
MKSQISFTTDIFESQTPKPHFISPRNFGEDLAEWLVEASRASAFKLGSPFQTEEGWTVPAQAGGESFEIGVGIMDESIGDAQANWLITVEKKRKWKVFSSRDSELRSELCDHIQNILRDKPHIREIRWTDQVGHFAR